MGSKKEFTLTILTEKGVLYFGPCEIVFLPTTRGEIAVMAHHTPMIIKLGPGRVRLRAGRDDKEIPSQSYGIAYVADDEVSVLIGL